MFDALTFHRFAHGFQLRGLRRIARVLTRLELHLFSAHIGPDAEIGPGCELGYGGIGVVIHSKTRIGKDVLVSPGVVIGGRSGLPGAPSIGDRVKIGAGAKILGPIKIGDDAHIGANAVVLHDVAAGDVVAGVPARPIQRKLKVLDGAG
jgi:serine O-acetyltransferase